MNAKQFESVTEIADRHCAEWQKYRCDVFEPCRDRFEEKELKSCKVVADIIKVMQEGERKSYLFASGERAVDTEHTYTWEGE